MELGAQGSRRISFFLSVILFVFLFTYLLPNLKGVGFSPLLFVCIYVFVPLPPLSFSFRSCKDNSATWQCGSAVSSPPLKVTMKVMVRTWAWRCTKTHRARRTMLVLLYPLLPPQAAGQLYYEAGSTCCCTPCTRWVRCCSSFQNSNLSQ